MRLKTFARTNEALVLYQTHKSGARIVSSINDATLHQTYFLNLMAVEDINYENTIDLKLEGIAKGLGVSFENTNNQSRRQSNDFRERMKERQRENKKKMNKGGGSS